MLANLVFLSEMYLSIKYKRNVLKNIYFLNFGLFKAIFRF